MRIAMVVMNDMAFDQRVHREASALGEFGHEVVVVCLNGQDLPAFEDRGAYRIQRCGHASSASWRRPVRKVAQSYHRNRVLVGALVALRPDVIHAHDTDTLPAAVRAADLTGAKLVYDAHELFPDQFEGTGSTTEKLVRLWWRSVERRLIPRTDAVVTVSPGLARVLEDRFGVRATIIRNTPALQPHIGSRRLREELAIDDRNRIILYQGLLLPERGLVPLVKAMVEVEGAVLVVQGTGPEEGPMRDAVDQLRLEERVRFMGWIAPQDAHDYACGADIGVVIYEASTLNNLLAGPNKLFNYLMAGLAVAGRDFPGLREVVIQEGVGDVFAEATAASIAKVLKRLLSDNEKLADMRKQARCVAESTYNWEREKRALLQLYHDLAGKED